MGSETLMYIVALCLMMIIMQLFCNCLMKGGSKPTRHVVLDHEYEVYGTMRCGYTVKMCKHLQTIGKTFKFIDVTANEKAYNNILRHFRVTRSGVPFTVHKPTDTYFIGYKEIV